MAAKRVLTDIKRDLDNYVGHKIRLRANRGRKRLWKEQGFWNRLILTFL